MEANKILNADFLDILFEGKNKSYGAYDLRKTYNSRMGKSMIVTGSVLLLIFLASLLAKAMEPKDSGKVQVKETQLAEVKNEPPPPPPPPPPPTPPPPPELKQIQFTPPKIVKDEEVKKDEKIPDLVPEAKISTVTVESENTKEVVQAPVEEKQSTIVAAPVKAESDEPFTKVEVEAGYPGGNAAFKRYLEKNLNGQVAADNEAPPGMYTVIVRFIVAKDGSISDVMPETSVGYGMEAEAVRVIKKSINWTPAQQNGNIVKAYRRQPIVFNVAE